MPLPDLIEIVPMPSTSVRAQITVPGSKSITNRALVLAALSSGEVKLQGALWSEDTQVMVGCLERLGFDVRVEMDSAEFCNRTITVQGGGGRIPRAGTTQQPLELFVGNAGTAARFLAAMVCLGSGAYRLSGVPRMHQRPQAALFRALRDLGYTVEATDEKLPAIIHGRGCHPGQCTVSIEQSSQFASALLLCSKAGAWDVSVVGENAEESPYVAMTNEMLGVFPKEGGTFQVEPDASSGSYFWGVPGATHRTEGEKGSLDGIRAATGADEFDRVLSSVEVLRWPSSGWQIDERFPAAIKAFPDTISRQSDLGDSIMTAIVLAAFQDRPKLFTDLGRLRVQECERVAALRTELSKCGVDVIEAGDTLHVNPGTLLHGAEIETYNDHRMAMCFAVFGLYVPGIRLRDPACVKKTFPNFFQKLAAPAPHGLGVTVLGGAGRPISAEELFAD
jgi:3-phosphoshikimate 1-carboxyvinyltransferase